jgi:hypothetical protein
LQRVVEGLLQLVRTAKSCRRAATTRAYDSSPPYKNILWIILTIAIMRVSNLVVAIVSLVVLVTTAECVGPTKGGADGKRPTRSVAAELAAAAGTTEPDVANNESIARSLQEDENKNRAGITDNSSASGGPSDKHLAEILQKEEDNKVCTSSPAKKSNKRIFQPRSKAKAACDALTVCCCSSLV